MNTYPASFASIHNWHDYAPSKTIIDIMEALGDARMPAYLTHVNEAFDPARARELIGTQKWIAL
jgi:hypothetical protein